MIVIGTVVFMNCAKFKVFSIFEVHKSSHLTLKTGDKIYIGFLVVVQRINVLLCD